MRASFVATCSGVLGGLVCLRGGVLGNVGGLHGRVLGSLVAVVAASFAASVAFVAVLDAGAYTSSAANESRRRRPRARAPPDNGDGGDHPTEDQQPDQEFHRPPWPAAHSAQRHRKSDSHSAPVPLATLSVRQGSLSVIDEEAPIASDPRTMVSWRTLSTRRGSLEGPRRRRCSPASSSSLRPGARPRHPRRRGGDGHALPRRSEPLS